jgi:hypothetical protein
MSAPNGNEDALARALDAQLAVVRAITGRTRLKRTSEAEISLWTVCRAACLSAGTVLSAVEELEHHSVIRRRRDKNYPFRPPIYSLAVREPEKAIRAMSLRHAGGAQ